MKVFAIASAVFFIYSTAAAVSSPADPVAGGNLAARDANPEALPGWWGYSRTGRGHGGWKRDASAAPEPWWWRRRGGGGWKRDAAPEPGLSERDVSGDDDFIYLPEGMTPEDLAKILSHEGKEPAPPAAK